MATNYREILRLAKLGYSQRSIAASAGCARSTVQRVLERAESNPHTLEELLALSLIHIYALQYIERFEDVLPTEEGVIIPERRNA